MKRIRIGDIEVHESKFGIEVVKWSKNELYGKEDDFVTEDGQTFKPKDKAKDFLSYDVSCFKNPETCYVIADIVANKDDFDVRSIGMRPWELEPQDEKDFKEVLLLLHKYFIEECEEERYA